MRMLFSILSMLLAILGLLPWILLQFNDAYFTIFTFGITGWLQAILPLIYSILSFLFALMAESGKGKAAALLVSILALAWNVIILIAALLL